MPNLVFCLLHHLLAKGKLCKRGMTDPEFVVRAGSDVARTVLDVDLNSLFLTDPN